MTAEELVERIQKLRVYRFKGQPALYQPITLLWAVGRASQGKARLVAWNETERELRELLRRHSHHGERGRPDYPVAALHRAGLWELIGHSGAVPTAHGDTELRRWFQENRPDSGLRKSAYDLVRDSELARAATVKAITDAYFDGLEYQDLLRDVRLP